MTTPTLLKGRTRWSLAARCPRMAGYAILGEEPAPEDPDTLLLFERGKLDEQWFIEHVLDPRFGRDNVIRQKSILWPHDTPIGELHTDAFIVSEGMPWEIKSHADGEPAEFDFLQLAGQIHFDPDATKDAGVLAVIDRNLKRDYIPVVLTDDLVEQVETTAAQVVTCARTGELPGRVCEKPADGRSRMCPFVSTCFADWTPPDPINLDGDIAMLAIETLHAQERKRTLTKQADEADAEYKTLAGRLAEYDLEPSREYVGPGVTVKRTAFPASEKFSLAKARKAGMWTDAHDELFAPFVNVSGAHDRWSFRSNDQRVSADDFGDEAPWTDEDLV